MTGQKEIFPQSAGQVALISGLKRINKAWHVNDLLIINKDISYHLYTLYKWQIFADAQVFITCG